MQSSKNEKSLIFNGTGYLIGFITTILIVIGIFILFENIVVAISSSIPIGTTLGIILEQKFQRGQKSISPQLKIFMFSLLIFG